MKMKLVRIGASNLKGATFSLNLKRATFVVGSNYEGKTTRLDAIRLLLVGFLPELGKKSDATFGLCSGRELRVEGTIEAEDGRKFEIWRRWYLKDDSIKSEKSLPPAFEENGLFETMLNADSWFGLTETERVDWVFRNVAIESDSPRAEILAEAMKAVLDGVEKKEIELVNEHSIENLFSFVDDAITEKEKDDGPLRTPDFLQAVLDAATDLGKTAKAHAAQMEKTVAGLAALRAADAAPADVSEIERKIRDANENLGRRREEKARIEAKTLTQGENRRRRTALERDLTGRPVLEARKEEFEAKVEEIKAKIAALPDLGGISLEDLRSEERDAIRALAKVEAEIGTLDASVKANEKEAAELDSKTVCAYCGASGEGWKALKSSGIGSALAGLRAKRPQLVEHKSRLNETVADLKRRSINAINALNERAALSDSLRSFSERLSGVNAQISLLAGKTGERDAIPADDPSLDDKLAEVNGAISLVTDEINRLDRERRSAVGRQDELRRLAQAEKERDQGRSEEKIAKTAANAFKAIKARFVEDAFRPILATANSFCGDLLPSPLAYNGEKASIGRWRDGLWVGHGTFSGLEQLQAFAGIQAAFAARAPVRVMVLDELLRAKNTRKIAAFDLLVAACKRAVESGLVDNFVGIIPGDPDEYLSLAGADEKDCQVVSVE